VQDIFGRDRFTPDPALGKGQILGDRCIQVVAHHQHVEVFVERVDRKGSGRVGRRGQHIRLTDHLQNIGRVPTAGALGVIGVNHPPPHRCDRRFHEPAFVQGIGMNRHLDIHLVCHAQAGVDRLRCRPPVFVQFEPDGARLDLFA
jgi:hypothetical protein